MNITCAIIDQLLAHGQAIDGTAGGLVLGPTHEEGGIKMFIRSGTNYELCGEMEGWEYILNPGASAHYQKTFAEINNRQRDSQFDGQLQLDYQGPVLNCTLPYGKGYIPGLAAKIIVFNAVSQLSIVNKFSTVKHLDELSRMNLGVTYRYNHEDLTQASEIKAVRIDGLELDSFKLAKRPLNSLV